MNDNWINIQNLSVDAKGLTGNLLKLHVGEYRHMYPSYMFLTGNMSLLTKDADMLFSLKIFTYRDQVLKNTLCHLLVGSEEKKKQNTPQ